jgi:alkylation response protein AidB-like acyl-CoA dehydrogenase
VYVAAKENERQSMILHPEPELLEFADEVRKLLAGSTSAGLRARWDDPRSYDERVWRMLMQDMGAGGLGSAQDDPDAPFLAQALILEQLGYTADDSPYFATVGLAIPMLVEAGTPDALDILSRLQTGEAVASLAISDEDGRWHPLETSVRAREVDDDWVIDGLKSYVVDATAADVFIVTAHTPDGIALFAISASDATVEPLRSVDLTRWLGRVTFAASPARLLSRPDAEAVISRGLDRASTLLAAELVGVAQRCMEMAVEYAKVRTQSGRAIGSFQAIKHKCADMLLAIETARAAVYFAARAADELPAQFPAAASIALSVAAETALQVTAENIQVHGGIGFTWEHDAHIYFRRANAAAQLLGSPAYHRRELITRILEGETHE